ncbi:chemotaxis protein CheC [Paenibacillus sp. PsM32]|uniref:Chemotaxis protein CheC n=1 Tax=Paenibacillus kyungheensis TaxID=1452732 RepID=A0AAX3M5L5_9BACL|nr:MULTISPECIES: chemotaxis protein CheC [Paenibacillus]MDN4616529.1 chemotaxis protein CheC [Paenibacillus sp. PsM32]MDQ1233682.1 chemotaxis protein CheC [Paenibacillus sp. SORGH_AS_0306]MDR6110723.1 chemotaxis protein CheC [Paenibacillus sp. SORGH_AS_0338]WCT57605.1 chemotaxis protein CheC [Paenibacillus kyungheensis]WDF49296.1 chemotaxis protein CheC [Paenibacillus sp. KACC 21273]
MNLFGNLEGFKMDVLKEVGNIGAGNAATALSQLLDKPIDMAVPKVQILPFEKIADKVGGPEQIVLAVFFRVEGEAPGNLFFILTPEAGKGLLHRLAGIEASDEEFFNEMEQSALSEIGNILAGSYLSSLADFTKLSMTPTVPGLAMDMAGAILNYGLIQFGEMGDDALLIDTTFLEGKEEVEGQFFLIPDPESFDKIFKSLGVPLTDD